MKILVIPLLAAFACSSAATVPLQVAQKVPAATGQLTVDEGKNGNHRVALDVDHLARPDAVQQNATAYVVWLKPLRDADTEPRNVGTLSVDDRLKGEFETSTAFRDFDIIVTAERSANVNKPRGQEVMSARVIDLNRRR
jgi:hypothetical protein